MDRLTPSSSAATCAPLQIFLSLSFLNSDISKEILICLSPCFTLNRLKVMIRFQVPILPLVLLSARFLLRIPHPDCFEP